jgi:ABC-type dipeptide/oligopeptide/nickel transport system ATPase component
LVARGILVFGIESLGIIPVLWYKDKITNIDREMKMEEEEIGQDLELINPDSSVDFQYKWDEEFQRHVISLIILDRQFLLQAMDLVKPKYFTNRAHQMACTIVFDFFKKYSVLPDKVFLVQEIKDHLRGNKSLPYYLGEINLVYDYFQPGMESRDYLTEKVNYFAKIMAVRNAYQDTVKMMTKGGYESEKVWGKVHEMWREALMVERNFDLGIDYFNTVKQRLSEEAIEADLADRFKVGFPSVDEEIRGGFSRGEILAIVAGSGVGKSVWLACFTAINVLRGKRGVYISCELKDTKVCDRMDAIFTGLNIKTLSSIKEDVFKRLDEIRAGMPVIGNVNDQRWYDNGVGVDTNPTILPNAEEFSPLIVKKFPAGEATVNTIRAYLSQLRYRGFNPDFVIVDYVGEMKDIPGMETHQSRERLVRNLRGMAEEENVFVAIAIQPNRGGKEAQKERFGKIDDTDFADSFGQIKPLDGAISLMQNDQEKQMGVGRGYVIKLRDGKSRFMFYLTFDQENLRIMEVHKDTYRSTMATFKEKAVDSLDIDNIKSMDAQVAEDKAKEKQKKRLEKREETDSES